MSPPLGLLVAAALTAQTLVVPKPDLSGLEDVVRAQLVSAVTFAEGLAETAPTGSAELADAYGAAGELYHTYEFREAAEACYRNAMAHAPNDYRWPYLLGVVLQSQGALSEAEAAFRRSLSSRDRNAAAHYHLGEVLRDQNRLDEAELAFFESLSAGGDSAARTALGEIAMLRRDFPAAVAHFEAALEATPEANRLHYLLGMAFRASGEPERARAHLVKSGPIGVRVGDPMLAEVEALKSGELAHLLRGRAAFRAGSYEEAVSAFREAVAANPASYRALVNLATALGTIGRGEEAIATYRKALELSPEGEAAHLNLGFLLRRAGRYEEAVFHLEQAVEALPEDAEAHFELAEAFSATSDRTQALEHYDRARALGKGEEAVLAAAQLLVDSHRYAEAVERLEASLERDPTQGLTTTALARLLAGNPNHELRDGKRALELASRAFDASPNASHAETVAMALAELGRCAEAMEWEQKALSTVTEASESRLEPMRETLARYRAGAPCQAP